MKLFEVNFKIYGKKTSYLTTCEDDMDKKDLIMREIFKFDDLDISMKRNNISVKEIKEIDGYDVILSKRPKNTEIVDYKNWKGCTICYHEDIVTNKKCQILSDRHTEYAPLVTSKFNVITVEDYDNWHGLYYVTMDENDKPILIKFTYGDILDGLNQSYQPKSVVEFALANNLKIDTISYIAICKNYIDRIDGNTIQKIFLPSLEDLDKVIVNAKGNSLYYHLKHEYDLISYIKYTNNK